ncbi:hypothetical protein [Planomonospora alba]|uniref:hypothetical protein n=1 Tax=Planomonospora alba TaxID=161354 RepID=UPI0031E66A49
MHVHALTRDFPVVSLTLSQGLKTTEGVPEGIPVDLHGDEFRDAAHRLEAQSSLSLREVPTLEHIVQRYRDYAVEVQCGRLPSAVSELEDSVLVPAAAGKGELANESIESVSRIASGWSRAEAPQGWESTKRWLAWLARRMHDAEGLATTVEEQILKHGLSKVRAS